MDKNIYSGKRVIFNSKIQIMKLSFMFLSMNVTRLCKIEISVQLQSHYIKLVNLMIALYLFLLE